MAEAQTDAFFYSRALRERLEMQACRKEVWRNCSVMGISDENEELLVRGVLPQPPPAQAVRCEDGTPHQARYLCTEICVANVDTLTAALEVGDAVALNFANATTPGGRYRSGGRAQEEDLCRLLPQLVASLESSGAYPLDPSVALLSRNLKAIRTVGTYALIEGNPADLRQCTIITAAMPCGEADRRPAGGWLGDNPWSATVRLRIRAVLHAAAVSGHANLVLGAFGCGAFGNPPGPVAAIFREFLSSAEFVGVFQTVVFAIIDPVGTGNLKPFAAEITRLARSSRGANSTSTATGAGAGVVTTTKAKAPGSTGHPHTDATNSTRTSGAGSGVGSGTGSRSAAGRLSKGAGTHLASWLQEVDNVSVDEAVSWLNEPRHPKTSQILEVLRESKGKNLGHAGPIVDAAFSGELLATKDKASLRLWRARGGTLLRVVGGCPGNGVAFSPTGQNIVTGTGTAAKVKIWGPAGGSAVGCGNAKITAGKA